MYCYVTEWLMSLSSYVGLCVVGIKIIDMQRNIHIVFFRVLLFQIEHFSAYNSFAGGAVLT